MTTWHALPDEITEPTTVIIVSPEENQTYISGNVTLVVNVGVQPIYDERGGDTHYIRAVYYTGDWMTMSNRIFYHLADRLMAQKITLTLNISRLGDGQHTLTVIARDSYDVEAQKSVNFTIDSQSIPEFPSWIVLPLLMVSMFVAFVVKKRAALFI